ncbi:osmotically inducible protein OsmC [Hymenobacter lapidarius]|uniref:Osmotically inducible protein OsmC n=1 Tax=Hymenobacter lapidarius TaxID=1908237 RepID=A0A1G1SXP8_9BACT|nr:OsmC family protein [Hymenobacter lapidarius]OGX83403.1 osmotically inducible protein OsmC [Hymenobacter lapidarius]
MNTATARYAGHLRTEATHVASGNIIQTDAPTDNHGRGEAFSPTDLVCTALGSCMMTVMGIVADRHSLDLVDSTFAVMKHMSTEAPRRIAQINVTFTMPAALSPSDRSLLERTALTCPVTLSLHPDIKQNVMFEYK